MSAKPLSRTLHLGVIYQLEKFELLFVSEVTLRLPWRKTLSFIARMIKLNCFENRSDCFISEINCLGLAELLMLFRTLTTLILHLTQ